MRAQRRRALGALTYTIFGFAILLVAATTPAMSAGPEGSGPSARPLGLAQGVPRGVATARQRVRAAERKPTFVRPGSAFDARRARGRTVFYLQLDSTFAVIAAEARGQAQAAKLVGVNHIIYNGKSSPTEFVRGMDTGIARKADVIIIDSISSNLLAAKIREARRAGIKVIVANERDERARPLTPVDGVTSFKYRKAGELMADWIIQDSGGRANILAIGLPEVLNTRDIKAGIDAELKALCPNCKITYANTTLANYSRVGTLARTELLKHRDTTYLLPFFDSMISSGIAGAVRQAGLKGKVKLVSWNATPAILALFKSNEISADVGAPNVWMGWAQMDQALRLMLDLPRVKNTQVPVRLWTSRNINQVNVRGDEVRWYGTNFQAGYKKLWRLTK